VTDLLDGVAARLRAAGCVYAEEGAGILVEAAGRDAAELESLVRQRVAGAPLEPLVGWVQFGSLRLQVGPGVFVPRQRSLQLARAAIGVAREQGRPVVLEPFCGVAPIAASIAATAPEAEVHVADIDPIALGYARRNLPVTADVHESDGLADVPGSLRGRLTLVASVPPYVPTTAADLIPREALDHEPGAALFAGADGLDHVRRLVNELVGWLAPDGVALIELNRQQYRSAAADARRAGWIASARRGNDGQTVLLELRSP
jgi:release factor glutamine methyltransferase